LAVFPRKICAVDGTRAARGISTDKIAHTSDDDAFRFSWFQIG